MDEAFDQMSGLATREVLRRQFEVFGEADYARLAAISNGHVYNLRASATYRAVRTAWTKTKGSAVNIGLRQAPAPEGMPGHVRVDTVHQGDRDGVKGIHLINLVDEVTQFEFVGAVVGISERFLVPLLEGLLLSFPFPILGFHADNGSEYINHRVAALLDKLRVERFTKSRARRSNDNALVEGKNANVVRKWFGHDHIPQRFAPEVNRFAQATLSPFLNFHRPCLFATEYRDGNGRIRRKYLAADVMTPYERLRSLPGAAGLLSPTQFEEQHKVALSKQAAEMSTQGAHSTVGDALWPKVERSECCPPSGLPSSPFAAAQRVAFPTRAGQSEVQLDRFWSVARTIIALVPFDHMSMTRRVPFNEAYKAWRNRARRYDRASIISGAMDVLCEPSPDLSTDLSKFPWLTMLMVKWVCQDGYLDGRRLPPISRVQLDDLRQRLWEFPERVDRPGSDIMTGRLFMRQMIRSQLGFQRGLSRSFVREAALLAAQPQDNPLRKLFKTKTGFDAQDFVDLSLATFGAVANGRREIPNGWFASLCTAYTAGTVSSFRSSVTRTLPELVTFCRSLSDTKRKVASEYFEFPSLTRYPFLRWRTGMVCWHPTVLYRGLENFVHSVLSEAGQAYMDPFSRLFERHVVSEAKKVPTRFVEEQVLRGWIAAETKVPDGLMSFTGSNVFVESKAGLFDESMMAVGNSEMFARKTRAIRKAVRQAWATSISLREERRAPACVQEADADYLLIVTNKDLVVSRGTVLASMCPEGSLKYPNPETKRLLPLSRIYLLSIDDFERLMNGAAEGIDIPSCLASCVADDSTPERALYLFEQHLDRLGVPDRFSRLVDTTIESALSRLESALSS